MARRAAKTRTKGRSCTGKPRHTTEEAARVELHRLATRSGSDPARGEVYPCEHCKGWHTGHGPRGKR